MHQDHIRAAVRVGLRVLVIPIATPKQGMPEAEGPVNPGQNRAGVKPPLRSGDRTLTLRQNSPRRRNGDDQDSPLLWVGKPRGEPSCRKAGGRRRSGSTSTKTTRTRGTFRTRRGLKTPAKYRLTCEHSQPPFAQTPESSGTDTPDLRRVPESPRVLEYAPSPRRRPPGARRRPRPGPPAADSRQPSGKSRGRSHRRSRGWSRRKSRGRSHGRFGCQAPKAQLTPALATRPKVRLFLVRVLLVVVDQAPSSRALHRPRPPTLHAHSRPPHPIAIPSPDAPVDPIR